MNKIITTFLSSAIIFSLNNLATSKEAVTKNDHFALAKKIISEDLSLLKHPKKPMLWKVTGNELTKPSYFFGSIHVSDKNILTLHASAEAAYMQADTLATEVNLELANQMKAMQFMMRKDGKALKQSIGEELHTELNQALAEINPVLNSKLLENMKTWSATVFLGTIEEQLQGKQPLDIQLWKRAGKDNKKQWALETLKEQLGYFDKLTEIEQVTLLKDSLFFATFFKKNKVNMLSVIKKLYLHGDPQILQLVLTSLSKIKGIDMKLKGIDMKLLLNNRNQRMANKIQTVFKDMPAKSHFIVAGTLHYTGDKSIIKLMKKLGYQVTRIEK